MVSLPSLAYPDAPPAAYVLKSSVSSAEIHTALQPFPLSMQEVDDVVSQTLKQLASGLDQFHHLPISDQNFDSVVIGWHDLLDRVQAKMVILYSVGLTTQDPIVIKHATKGAESLGRKLTESCQDEAALAMLLAYAERAIAQPDGLLPNQAYILRAILASVPETNPLKTKARALEQKLTMQPMLAYLYQRGEGVEKRLPENRALNILSWNVCCLDHSQSMLFGGVLPWRDRLNRLASQIQTFDADIVCLQEMFTPEACLALWQKLRTRYAHCYLQIGPKPCGFDPSQFGLPSGLFVMSRYPLKNVTFVPYNQNEAPPNRGYGFCSAEIVSGDRTVAQLITTHLQPGDDPADMAYRSAQLQAIAGTAQKGQWPLFLCGDLNIERNSPEEQKLSSYQQSHYQGSSWSCCELRDYWWRANQDALLFQTLPLKREWLDYFTQLRNGPPLPMHTEVLSLTDLAHPNEALSDHQPLLTQVTLPPFKE